MIDAIVVVEGAVLSAETQSALASVVIPAIQAAGSILARIKFFGAELNLLLAKVS